MDKQNVLLNQLEESISKLDLTIDRLSEEFDQEDFVLKAAPLMQKRDQLKQQFNSLSRQSLQDWQDNLSTVIATIEKNNRGLTEAVDKINHNVETIAMISNILSYADEIIAVTAAVII